MPIVLVSMASITIYSFIRWYFDFKFGPIPINQELKDLWLPMILAWVLILFVLRKRIRILDISGRRDQGHFLFQILVWCLMFIPTIISQFHISKSFFGLVEIENIEQIKRNKKEKYFKLKDLKLNESVCYFEYHSRVRDKKLILNINVLYPLNSEEDIYYGLDFEKKLKNPKTLDKEIEFKKFYNEIRTEISKKDLFDFEYFEKLFRSEERSMYFSEWDEDESSIVLIPKRDNFKDRIGNHFFWIFGSFGIVLFLILFVLLFVKIDKEEYVSFKTNKPMKNNDFSDILYFLNPFGTHKATAIIILVSLIMLFINILNGGDFLALSVKNLIDIGGCSRSLIFQGDYWRLASSLFIYFGFHHLLFNLGILGFIGYMWEKKFGSVNFFILFLLFGISGSIANMYWDNNMLFVGGFASICGFLGMYSLFLIMNIFNNETRIFNWLFVLALIFVCVILYWLEVINLVVLIGGFSSGVIVGLLLVLNNKRSLIKMMND